MEDDQSEGDRSEGDQSERLGNGNVINQKVIDWKVINWKVIDWKTAKTLQTLSNSITTIITTHLSPNTQLTKIKLTNTLRTLKAKQNQYRKHLNTLGHTKNTPIASYHTSFGQAKLAAQLIIPTPKTQTNANTHYLKPTAPHLSPLKIPASGPKQRIEATHSTQQAQMDLPPGKAIHYVDLTSDQVGANGIKVDPTDPDKPPRFSLDLTPIHKQYNTPPGKARYRNFTLNLLTRMHPAWATSLDTLIPIILACRKRPISILQALDSHLDSIV